MSCFGHCSAVETLYYTYNVSINQLLMYIVIILDCEQGLTIANISKFALCWITDE